MSFHFRRKKIWWNVRMYNTLRVKINPESRAEEARDPIIVPVSVAVCI